MNRRNRGVLIGVLSGAAAAVVAEAVRPRGPGGTPIDWEEIARLSARAGADDGGLTAAQAAQAAAAYNRMAAELAPALYRFTGKLPKGVELPPFQALDRARWIEVNVGIMRRVTEPLLEANPMPSSILLDLGRAGLDRYVAALLGFLSRRVLGQFDPDLLGAEPVTADTTGLYLVETNVRAFEAEANLPPDEIRRWLILHEMTHAWQFLGHPWLRAHMNEMVEEVLAAAGRSGMDPIRRTLGFVQRLPGQLALMRRLQATMTLVEGYSNLVMDVVGREQLGSFEQLERAHAARGSRRTALEQLFWRVTGLGVKLRQYEVGERFCVAVHREHGIEALNLAWVSAEHLPRLDEFADPERWFRRVSARG